MSAWNPKRAYETRGTGEKERTLNRFFVEQSDAAGNVFTDTGHAATPYQVFEGEVAPHDKGRLHILAPAWMREQQDQGFGYAHSVLTVSDAWEVDGPVRELTRREYMQIAKKERPQSIEWEGEMSKLFEEVSVE
jgi:hypothetical protein